jgi:transcriptional regulator with XRE-family HTH domain
MTGEELAARRLALGLSRNQASAVTGIRERTLHAWEAGDRQINPNTGDALRRELSPLGQAAETLVDQIVSQALAQADPAEPITIRVPAREPGAGGPGATRPQASRRAFLTAAGRAAGRLEAQGYEVRIETERKPTMTDIPRTEITSDAWRWLGLNQTQDTLEDAIREAIGAEFVEDFDIEAIAADYRKAIEDVLPDGWTINGNSIYAPATPDTLGGVPDELHEALTEQALSINLWDLCEPHEKEATA